MKRILSLIGLLAFALAGISADVTLEWDPNAPAEGVVEYRLYEQVGADWELRGTATGTTITVSGVPVGTHTYVVTAVNANAEESDHSNTASTTIYAPVSPPTGLRVTVVVTVEVP